MKEIVSDFLQPAGFDPDCHRCDTDQHVCPGCGANVPHGTSACDACNERHPLIIDLDATAAAWLEAVRAADAKIAELKEIRDRAAGHVQAAMGDATEARIGGRPVVTWKPSKPGTSLDRKGLEKHLGAEVLAQFIVTNKAARPFKVLDVDGA